MAYLIQMHRNNKGNIVKKGTISYVQYEISNYMSCGNTYHDNPIHKFSGTNAECNLLIPIFKHFTRVVKIHSTKNSEFVFEAIAGNKPKVQKIFFKLCRYVRNEDTRRVLKSILDLINNGVKPYNALLLGHYSVHSMNSLKSSMDIVYPSRVHHTFRNWNQFIARLNLSQARLYINSTYLKKASYNNNSDLIMVKDMLKHKQYPKLQRMLLVPKSK